MKPKEKAGESSDWESFANRSWNHAKDSYSLTDRFAQFYTFQDKALQPASKTHAVLRAPYRRY